VDSFNGDTVLDLGCGPHGGLIGFTNCKKYGVDDLINEYKLIGYPLDQYQIEYIHAPAEKLPFPDRFFTTIVCVNALDHMDNIQKVFSEMSRVLMNTGHILLQVMFHSKPRVGHPICLNTQQMLLLCSEYSLVVLECSFQRVGGGNKCDRDDVYFYKLFKLGESIK
jgi:ubiquinone/menaquinone biosynthesis C-methylase UbiE